MRELDKQLFKAIEDYYVNPDIETVKQLIKEGADINAVDYCGYTPLRHATEMGLIRVMKILIDAGADVNVRDTDIGVSPLESVREKREAFMQNVDMLVAMEELLIARGAETAWIEVQETGVII